MNDQLNSRIRLVTGDIAQLAVDAVVTAANEGLRGGGGVDGAVHAAAGPGLVKASRKLAPCPTGEARITPAFDLDAKHVIHAVGPVYHGRANDAVLLASAYRSSLELAAENALGTIAFPCISTGVYGYPSEEACEIAVRTVVGWLEAHDLPKVVTFCCFAADDEMLYRRRLAAVSES